MDKNLLQDMLNNRIGELEAEKANCEGEIARLQSVLDACDIKIWEIKSISHDIDKLADDIKKETIKGHIRRNITKNVLVESDDQRRINIFLEYMDKCGDETVYRIAHSKMRKLGTVLYGKKRLWPGWKEFREDFHDWVVRAGKWEGILDRKEGE